VEIPLAVDEFPKSNRVYNHADEWTIGNVKIDCSEKKEYC